MIIVDPAMGDNGKLYKGFTGEFALEMANLCSYADVIVPNLTEAAFMLGEEYCCGGYDSDYTEHLLKNLAGLGADNIILTGAADKDGRIGAAVYSGGEIYSYFTERVDGMFHGTGDIFASVCTGALVRGASIKEAAKLAVDFVYECIMATADSRKEQWYGVRFEDCIGYLVDKTKKLKGKD